MISVAKHPAEMLGVFSMVYMNGDVTVFFSLEEEDVVTR